jgi:sulfur-oxidizing protein SoxZ
MAQRGIKIRTRMQDGLVEVLVLIKHPMETGLRKDKKTGEKIPAHFIQKVVLEHNGKAVVTMDSGIGVSEDPLLGFRLLSAKNGDKIRVSWYDNRGESGVGETTVDLS